MPPNIKGRRVSTLGQLVKAARIRTRMSQREFAKLTKYTHPQISDLERGKRQRVSPKTLYIFAQHLPSVTYEQLLEARDQSPQSISFSHDDMLGAEWGRLLKLRDKVAVRKAEEEAHQEESDAHQAQATA